MNPVRLPVCPSVDLVKSICSAFVLFDWNSFVFGRAIQIPNSEISHRCNWFPYGCVRICGLNKYPIIKQIFICHNEFGVHLWADVQLIIWFESSLEKWMYGHYGDMLLIRLVGVTILFLPFRHSETIYCNLFSVIRLILISTEQNSFWAVNRFNAHTQWLIDRNEMKWYRKRVQK